MSLVSCQSSQLRMGLQPPILIASPPPLTRVVIEGSVKTSKITNFVVDPVSTLKAINSVAMITMKVVLITSLLVQPSENGNLSWQLVTPGDRADPLFRIDAGGISDSKSLRMRLAGCDNVQSDSN
jgi:hypothetical protein